MVIFDGSFEGYLCVVYAVYYEKISPTSIQVEGHEQLSLDHVPITIQTDVKKSARVLNAICEKISEDAAQTVYRAFHSFDERRFMAILSYIRHGFTHGHMVDSHLRLDFVLLVHKLAQHVWREAHLLFGFCRFEETSRGVFYCEVSPKNDVLPMLAEHFSQRLMNQAWVIRSHSRAAIYDGNTYVIVTVPASRPEITLAEGEAKTQELWVAFFESISIDQRKNKKLQRQLLPLYFRKNMTEFKNPGSLS